MKYKKICSIILVLIFFSASSVGCTKKDSSKDAKQINIYVGIKDTKSLSDLKNLFDGYKKENAGIKMNITSSIGNIMEENTSTSIPDIMFISRNDMIKLVNKGLLSDIKSYNEENKIDERYFSIFNSYGRINDKSYGVPILTSTLEVLYNMDAINKLKLNEPKDSASIRELIKNLNKGSVRIPVVINENKYINSELFSLLVNNTIDISKLDGEYDGGLEAYKNIQMNRPFDILKTMVKDDILGKYTFEIGNESTMNKFDKGDIPLIVATSAHINELKSSSIKCYDNHSKYKEVIPVIAEALVCVPTGSKNSEEVSKLIKYMFSETAQKNIIQSGAVTGNKSLKDLNKGLAGIISAHLEKADESAIIYTDKLPEKLKDAMESKIDLILSGKFSNNEWEDILKSIY